MEKCAAFGKKPYSMGIDTWAVDFVLLDENDRMLGDAIAYRDGRTAGMDPKVYERITEDELYKRTGIQKQIFNTIYQLMAVKENQPDILEKAKCMLMIPDYFHFLLTEKKVQEYTNATTTQLVNPETKEWDLELIDKLGYPRSIFQKIENPGYELGNLTGEIQSRVGFDCKVVLPPTHDTASAVMAVPTQDFAKKTGIPCVMNIWTGDGFKDIPADRMGPRLRYKDSIEQILSEPFDKDLVKPCVESKVFGIGVESYTVGSAEFTLSFAALHDGCMPLMDNGHYHPLEYVSDKIPALLCFYPEFALHITRGVRWDSDHVLILDDETKEMAKEIVRNDALDRVYMALDYFDASINRVSALATGFRSWQKALLMALCTPNEMLKELQDTNQMSRLMVMNEAVKMLPFGEIWDEYCNREGVVDDWHFFDEIEKYENEVLSKRA